MPRRIRAEVCAGTDLCIGQIGHGLRPRATSSYNYSLLIKFAKVHGGITSQFTLKWAKMQTSRLVLEGLQQGFATSGPRATTQPAKPFSVALPNTLIFPIMHENPNVHEKTKVYTKKLNFSCGPARCLKLVIWPTDKKCCTPLAYSNNTIISFVMQYKNDNTTFHRSSAVSVALALNFDVRGVLNCEKLLLVTSLAWKHEKKLCDRLSLLVANIWSLLMQIIIYLPHLHEHTV